MIFVKFSLFWTRKFVPGRTKMKKWPYTFGVAKFPFLDFRDHFFDKIRSWTDVISIPGDAKSSPPTHSTEAEFLCLLGFQDSPRAASTQWPRPHIPRSLREVWGLVDFATTRPPRWLAPPGTQTPFCPFLRENLAVPPQEFPCGLWFPEPQT